jgi:hypothetical protein
MLMNKALPILKPIKTIGNGNTHLVSQTEIKATSYFDVLDYIIT